MKNALRGLRDFGQSVWYDNIERTMLCNGEMLRMVEEDGLAGMTSNPTIFEKALKGDESYESALRDLFRSEHGGSDKEVFFSIAIEDIQHAADILRPVYDETGHEDGMVSLEVSPDLAHDTDATIAEAKALHARVDRPNLMIKVPATREGLPAITALIAAGINVNATLLFSLERYEAVAEAYLAGLEARVQAGLPVADLRSVASFFVSRVDSKVDAQLREAMGRANSGEERAHIEALMGRAAIANAGAAYALFRRMLADARFQALAAKGAHPQRLLWASTGTKDPAYSDILYVSTLVGPNTVNTMPPATYRAYRDHGHPSMTIDDRVAEAESVLSQLRGLGIDLDAVTDQLEVEGVRSFMESFDSLLGTIAARRAEFKAERRVS